MDTRTALSARSRLIEILAERIVAEWAAEGIAPLEPAAPQPHNVTHHDKADPTPARRLLQPVQL